MTIPDDHAAPGEDCWRPEDADNDDLAAAHGILHGLCIMILAACCIYIGIRVFDFDSMHEPPVEIGETP